MALMRGRFYGVALACAASLGAGFALASLGEDDGPASAVAAGATPPPAEGGGLLMLQIETSIKRELPPTIEGRIESVDCRRVSGAAGLCSVTLSGIGAGDYLVDVKFPAEGGFRWWVR